MCFFDSSGPEESGLLFKDNVRFTGADLAEIDPIPRMAFVNACKAIRVRGIPTTKAILDELFLHNGTVEYLGTYWEVSDDAAKIFAETVHVGLEGGSALEKAT